MPAVVIGRSDICPPSASQGSEDARSCDHCWKTRIRFAGEEIEEGDEGESRTGCYGNEKHKEGTLRVSIANGGGDGWKPFIGIAKPLILYNFAIMQPTTNDQCAEKSSICNNSMAPSDVFGIKLDTN